MPVFPAILCGGAGARLWPASRPGREKPFAPLLGSRSALQETALRAAPLGLITVVGAASRAELIGAHLAPLNLEYDVILEPLARDTAAAAAAAALLVSARDPDGVVVLLPADHHIPDGEAFRAAVTACVGAAESGQIVTLGVRPDGPSSAYGYIRPGAGEGVRPVEAFVEKPGLEAATRLIAEGALWNSGVFIARADVLISELERWAPEVLGPVRAGFATAAGGVLGVAGEIPAMAFDRAVMEKTALAAILPVDFAWSDLGSWDAVWAAARKDEEGNSLPPSATAIDAREVLVRAPSTTEVAVVGVSRVAVVVEPNAVLVAALDAAQAVRGIDRGRPATFASLDEAADWGLSWLATAALPVWATLGVEHGVWGFREGLTQEGRAHDPRRRARVQARQAIVFAQAAIQGLPGPWLETARSGYRWFEACAQVGGGLYAHTLSPTGEVIDAEPRLYESAFILLALATLAAADPAEPAWRAQAQVVLSGIKERFRDAQGGFKEFGDQPFQANAQMHLLEAALTYGDKALADELAQLALTRFIDPATGAVREHYAADWSPLATDLPQIEPGHQFEWAFLLHSWGGPGAEVAALRLYEAGLRGVDPARGVVVNTLNEDLTIRDAAARLWPQTEFLRAAVTFGHDDDALTAATAIRRFLDVPVRGLWRERMAADGAFLDEPAPATSLYHLTTGLLALAQRLR